MTPHRRLRSRFSVAMMVVYYLTISLAGSKYGGVCAHSHYWRPSPSDYNGGDNLPSMFDSPPDLGENFEKAKDTYDKAKDAYEYGKFIGDSWNTCKATGATNKECYAQTAFCALYTKFAPAQMMPFVPSVKKWCLGEPTLKCCRKIGSPPGCWSAFNDFPVINCESPGYGPTESPGECLYVQGSPINGGCDCRYIPICDSSIPSWPSAPPAGGGPKPDNPYAGPYTTEMPRSLPPPPPDPLPVNYTQPAYTMYDEGRRVGFVKDFVRRAFNKLGAALSTNYYASPVLGMNDSAPDAVLDGAVLDVHNSASDLVNFRGCADYLRRHLGGNANYSAISAWDIRNTWSNVVRRDPFRTATEFARRLEGIALTRLAQSVPGFWSRVDWALGWRWNATDKERFVEAMRSRDELSARLGPALHELLDAQLVLDKRLIAAPLDFLNDTEVHEGSFPIQPPSDALDGCRRGEPVELDIVVVPSTSPGHVKLNVRIVDPMDDASDPFSQIRTGSVDWGDTIKERVSQYSLLGHELTHVYAEAGVYVVTVVVMNSAGLHTQGLVTIRTEAGSQSATTAHAWIAAVTLDFVAQGDDRGRARLPTIVRAQTRSGAWHALGSAAIVPKDPDSFAIRKNYIDRRLKFSWALREPISGIAVTCRAYQNYLYASSSLRLKNITLHFAPTIGHKNRSVTIPYPTHGRYVSYNASYYAFPATPWKVGDLWAFHCARRGDVYEDAATEGFLNFTVPMARSQAPDIPGFQELASSEVGAPAYVQRELRPGEFTQPLEVPPSDDSSSFPLAAVVGGAVGGVVLVAALFVVGFVCWRRKQQRSTPANEERQPRVLAGKSSSSSAVALTNVVEMDDMDPPGDDTEQLPAGWSVHETDDGVPYYFNATTNESRWELK